MGLQEWMALSMIDAFERSKLRLLRIRVTICMQNESSCFNLPGTGATTCAHSCSALRKQWAFSDRSACVSRAWQVEVPARAQCRAHGEDVLHAGSRGRLSHKKGASSLDELAEHVNVEAAEVLQASLDAEKVVVCTHSLVSLKPG